MGRESDSGVKIRFWWSFSFNRLVDHQVSRGKNRHKFFLIQNLMSYNISKNWSDTTWYRHLPGHFKVISGFSDRKLISPKNFYSIKKFSFSRAFERHQNCTEIPTGTPKTRFYPVDTLVSPYNPCLLPWEYDSFRAIRKICQWRHTSLKLKISILIYWMRTFSRLKWNTYFSSDLVIVNYQIKVNCAGLELMQLLI